MEMYFIFGGMIFLFIFGNLGIHYYYKNKHQELIKSLKGKNYKLISKVNMTMESSAKIAFSYQRNKADVIFLGDEIFLLLFSKPFPQAQPILQISNNDKSFSNISKKISFNSKFNLLGKLRIKGNFGQGITSGNYTIFLDFTGKDFDINSIL
jgi:hypothetical protein